MARISGIDLPHKKRIEVSLTYIYGIGLSRSRQILKANNINKNSKTKDLTEEEIMKLRDYIELNLKVEGELRSEVSLNIKRLMDISCYRGLRHRRGLPVHGQRTSTNAKTRRSKKNLSVIRNK